MRAASLVCVCVAGLALVACSSGNRRRGIDSGAGTDSAVGTDSSMVTDSGPGTDSSVGTDSGGRPDTGIGRDSGTADPCEAGDGDPSSTVGCNGGVYGSTSRGNEIGGACTLDGTATEPVPGSCMAGPVGSMNFCTPEAEGASTGTCVYVCAAGGAYVSTGGCPAGSRCFSLTDVAVCFRDCTSSADCFAGEMCDGEGSCVVP